MTVFTIDEHESEATFAKGVASMLLVGRPYVAGYGRRYPGILIAITGVGQ